MTTHEFPRDCFKVFLVLYFWYLFLFVVAFLFTVYRGATLLLPQFRERVILSKARWEEWHELFILELRKRESNVLFICPTKNRGNGLKVPLRQVLRSCQAGDWFVLNQVSLPTSQKNAYCAKSICTSEV